MWWHIPVIPGDTVTRGSGAQGQLQLHSESEAILGYKQISKQNTGRWERMLCSHLASQSRALAVKATSHHDSATLKTQHRYL